MKACYVKYLSELINMVEKSRESILNNHNRFEEEIGDLAFLGDKRYGAYKAIVDTNEYRAAKTVEKIAVALLCENKDINFSLYPIDGRLSKLPPIEQSKSRPFQIILNKNNKRIGIIFCTRDDIPEKVKCYENGNYVIDSLKIIVLSAPDEFAYKILFADVNNSYQQKGINVEKVPILDFWEECFGSDERDELIDFFNQFNEKAKEIIGFNTVITPTEKAVSKFKIKCYDTLINKAKVQNIPKVFSDEYEILQYNYIERQLCRAMIGNCNFAKSFITSEWFYNMYQLTENLDLTAVVSGYLKSIEQLLFSIIQLSAGTGITIRGKDRKIIELTEDNNDIVDTTLGALENVIKHNGQILETSNYAKDCLLEIIDDWRSKQRNGYFHKHNLHSLSKVDEIRDKAFQLYFLILGSCLIKDEQFNKLGIEI